MTEILLNAVKHDKFSERFLMRSPHAKLRFCMYDKRGRQRLFVSHATQIIQECTTSITSSIMLPDRDLFAMHKSTVSTGPTRSSTR